MAHEWIQPPRTAAAFLNPPDRVCTKCGARQELEVDYAWGRVVSRRWMPLVGRCPGKKSTKG